MLERLELRQVLRPLRRDVRADAAAVGPRRPARGLPARRRGARWKARGKGGGTNQTIASLWGPLLMQTDNNTLIAFAEVDRSPTDHDGFMQLRRSHDGGASWEPAREVRWG